jgi:hypothetical protein
MTNPNLQSNNPSDSPDPSEEEQDQHQMASSSSEQYRHAAALAYYQARQGGGSTTEEVQQGRRYQPIQPRAQEPETPRSLSTPWIMYRPDDMSGQAQAPEEPAAQASSTSSSQQQQRPPLDHAQTTASNPSLPRCWEHGCNGRTFSCAENYRRHIRERSGGSRATCPGCHHQFSRKSNLDAHIASGKCKAMQAWLAEAAALETSIDYSQDWASGLYWDGSGWSVSGPSRPQR